MAEIDLMNRVEGMDRVEGMNRAEDTNPAENMNLVEGNSYLMEAITLAEDMDLTEAITNLTEAIMNLAERMKDTVHMVDEKGRTMEPASSAGRAAMAQPKWRIIGDSWSGMA